MYSFISSAGDSRWTDEVLFGWFELVALGGRGGGGGGGGEGVGGGGGCRVV